MLVCLTLFLQGMRFQKALQGENGQNSKKRLWFQKIDLLKKRNEQILTLNNEFLVSKS